MAVAVAIRATTAKAGIIKRFMEASCSVALTMTKHVIINVTGRCDGVKQVCTCSKVIEIAIPDGMFLHRAIEYVTEHAASEIARYAAARSWLRLP
jgi:hypothetical protein